MAKKSKPSKVIKPASPAGGKHMMPDKAVGSMTKMMTTHRNP